MVRDGFEWETNPKCLVYLEPFETSGLFCHRVPTRPATRAFSRHGKFLIIDRKMPFTLPSEILQFDDQFHWLRTVDTAYLTAKNVAVQFIWSPSPLNIRHHHQNELQSDIVDPLIMKIELQWEIL